MIDFKHYSFIHSTGPQGHERHTIFVSRDSAKTPDDKIQWLPKVSNGSFGEAPDVGFTMQEALHRAGSAEVAYNKARNMLAIGAVAAGVALVTTAVLSTFVAVPFIVGMGLYFAAAIPLGLGFVPWLFVRSERETASRVADVMQGVRELQVNLDDRDAIEDARILTLSVPPMPWLATHTGGLDKAIESYIWHYDNIHGDPNARG